MGRVKQGGRVMYGQRRRQRETTEMTDTKLDTRKWYTLAAACLALFMAILDNLVVNVALPTISRDLQASTTQLQWIVSAYTLVFASIQITAGGLGDRLGRKRWFLFGLALFTGASLFGAFSQNVGMLIAARAIQGLGAAFIMPLTLSLISVAFPPEERGKAIGIWSAISVSGLAFGPIIGGALVQYASWHWVFLINVPIGILTFILSLSFVRESRDESGEVAFDLPGTLLITGAVASLTWALIEAGDRGWGDVLILAAFALAAALLGAFIAVEARVRRPMVPLGFFRSSTFTGANIDSFAISFAIGAVAFFLTLYQQNVHGFSPVRSGLSLLPLVLMMMAGAPLSGILVSRIGARLLISIGMIISGVGTLLFLRAAPDARYVDLLPGFLVLGAGNSLIFAPMTTAVLNSVESHRSGVASAVNGAIREIGTAFSIALLGTLANRVYRADYTRAPEIVAARMNPAYPPPVQQVIDFIGRGSSFGGRVIEDPQRFPGLPAPLVAQIRAVSSAAFVHGMHSAVTVASFGMFAVSIVSFALIRDKTTKTETVPALNTLPAEAPVPAATTNNGYSDHETEVVPAYAVPFVVPPGNGYATNGYAINGYATNGNDANGYAAYHEGTDMPASYEYAANGFSPPNYAAGGVAAYTSMGTYQASHDAAPLPGAPWEPAYNNSTQTYPQADINGYTSSPPAFYAAYPPPVADPEPASPLAFAAHAWVPAAEPAPPAATPPFPDNVAAYHVAPVVTPVVSPPSTEEALLADIPIMTNAVVAPEALDVSDAEETPAPPVATDEPTVEYDATLTSWPFAMPTPVVPPTGAVMAVPPGMFAPPPGPPPAVVVMRDDELMARVATLEQFAHDSAARFHDDELDVLVRKVAVLEDAVMRFITEVPIRLGGEIGVLEQRVAHLTEASEAWMNAEPAVSAEMVEELDRKMVALERFTQTLPSPRWHQQHAMRSEALEQRVMELEQFCATLARRGTTPRGATISTVGNGDTTGETGAARGGANGKANGFAAVRTTTGTSGSRNGVSRQNPEEREGERRRSK